MSLALQIGLVAVSGLAAVGWLAAVREHRMRQQVANTVELLMALDPEGRNRVLDALASGNPEQAALVAARFHDPDDHNEVSE